MTAIAEINEAEINEVENLPLTAEEQQFVNAAPGVPQPEQPNLPGVEAEPVVVEVKSAADFGKKLRAQTMAVKLHRKKWGINKKLDRQHVEQAADEFNADVSRISASKKLIDSRAKAFRACISTINDAVGYWRDMTVPYPELGVRLMRKDKLAQFEHVLNSLKAQLAENVENLQLAYADIVEEARQKLGDVFNPMDYPNAASLASLFALDWEYPSLQPDQMLKQLNPALYEAEHKRIQARFDEAVKLAEEAFVAEFAELVGNLANRLKLGDDGKPKMFRNEAVGGLLDFFKRFKDLSVGSNDQLEGLIDEAQQIIAGKDDGIALAKELRKDNNLRDNMQRSMAELSGKLDSLLVNKPARKMFLLDDLDVAQAAGQDEPVGGEQAA